MLITMPASAPLMFPQERRALAAMGERIRLARLRRKLSMEVVAGRAGISRSTLYAVEAGEPTCTLGTYFRVLAVLSLERDFDRLAADDTVGRKLQDLGLEPSPRSRAPRQAGASAKKQAVP